MGSQVPKKATRGPVWVGFKTTRRCCLFARDRGLIAEPVVEDCLDRPLRLLSRALVGLGNIYRASPAEVSRKAAFATNDAGRYRRLSGARQCGCLRSPRTEVRLTHRWREMDSNFQYAGAVNLVVGPFGWVVLCDRVRTVPPAPRV